VIALARALMRVVEFLVVVALAIAGIVLAVFCIGTGTAGPSLGRLAELLHLAALRDNVGHWLGQLEASGSVAVIAGLCGVGAILLGLLLLAGIFVPHRERLVVLVGSERGVLGARRRVLAQIAKTLVEQVRGVSQARVRVHARRRTTGGRMAVRASRARTTDPRQLQTAVREQLSPLTEPFALSARVEVAQRVERVQ
jgi:hypothetical protein